MVLLSPPGGYIEDISGREGVYAYPVKEAIATSA